LKIFHHFCSVCWLNSNHKNRTEAIPTNNIANTKEICTPNGGIKFRRLYLMRNGKDEDLYVFLLMYWVDWNGEAAAQRSSWWACGKGTRFEAKSYLKIKRLYFTRIKKKIVKLLNYKTAKKRIFAEDQRQ